jgi:hypothetical protein
MKPKIPERTNYFLTQFTNRKAFHQLDMEHFYHFIHAAHIGRTKLSKCDLIQVLIDRGYTQEESKWLGDIYFHGRAILANKIIPSYLYPPPN